MQRDKYLAIVEEALDELLTLANECIEEMTEELEVVKSPEKLIGKPYEQWTEQDKAILYQIYGPGEPNALSDLVFSKELEQVEELEAEEL